MPLPYMHILMQDDLLPLFFSMQLRIDIDGIPKRKGRYRFSHLVDPDLPIPDQPRPMTHLAQRNPSHRQPDQKKARPRSQHNERNIPGIKTRRLPPRHNSPQRIIPDRRNILYHQRLTSTLYNRTDIDQRNKKTKTGI